MTHILGVDAGNTKTIALVARRDGVIVGAGRGGCGDIYGHGVAAAMVEVERAVREALAASGVRPDELDAGAFSMAGADWPEDFVLLDQTLCGLSFGRTITIVNDALGALRAGSIDGTGVSVVCGTGIAIGARAADGRFWHGSFWLEPLGAAELGRKTLRAIYRAELGLDPPTTLTGRVLEFLQATHVEEVLHRFTARERTQPVSERQLARVLLDAASAGDATACRIVREHGTLLGDYTLAAARRVGIENAPFTLVLSGGVLRHPARLLHEALLARVRTVAPDVRAVDSRFEPAVGALLLGLEAADVPIDAPLLARLSTTLPPSALFAT